MRSLKKKIAAGTHLNRIIDETEYNYRYTVVTDVCIL